jgi:ubiquinone/menaquinone biosynthesis C-methylase UbiE
MTASTRSDPAYLLGSSDAEHRRLVRQGELINPFTLRLLADAGITRGMRVLDLGTGAGDVALMAADLVGPTGRVVGIDRDPNALGVARARAEAAGLANLTYQEGDVNALAFEDRFDAVVGRLILLFAPDPVHVLRAAARQVRPGGIVAFQEWHLTVDALQCSPRLPLWERVWGWIMATMAGAGIQMGMGYELHRAYQAAGLPTPEMVTSAPLIRGADPGPYEWAAETLRSMLPLTEKLGIATAHEMDIDSLASRLRAETLAADGVVRAADLVGTWARTPAS